MKRISGVLVLVAALTGMAAGASGASAASTKCQPRFTEARHATQVTVSGDTCANARKVADRAAGLAPKGCVRVLDRKGHVGFRKSCVQRGYSCTAVQVSKRRALRVTCTRGSGLIRFNY